MTSKEEKQFFRWEGDPTVWEMVYLSNIGNFSGNQNCSKLELLKKYKKASEKRKNWGKINKEKILSHVDALISTLEGK